MVSVDSREEFYGIGSLSSPLGDSGINFRSLDLCIK